MKKLLTLGLLLLLVGCQSNEVNLDDYIKADIVRTAWQEVNVYDFYIEEVELDENDSIYLKIGELVKECDFLQLYEGGTLFTCEYEFSDEEWLAGFLENDNHVYYKEID